MTAALKDVRIVAGQQAPGYVGDGGPAAASRLNFVDSVVIDGQPMKTLTLRSDSSWGGSFHREGARWAGGPQPERGLRKRHGLQGPIDDAFMSAFLVVTPSAVSRNPRFETWAQAEMADSLREWRRQFRRRR